MTWALVGAVLIGLSLGLSGSGGSILTVPLLTYLVGQDEKVAIASSLAIVGAISLVSGLPYARRGLVEFRSVVFFGIPGMAGAHGGAFLSQFVPGGVQLAVFALLMLVAAVFMLRPLAVAVAGRPRRAALKIAGEGALVGVVTGFLGVGGGFLIVPALVQLGGLPMRRAVGTSLLIIALASFAGFAKHVDVLAGLGLSLDWQVIAVFVALGILGGFAGNALCTRLPQQVLRRAFAVFLLLVGTFIVARSWPQLAQEGGRSSAPTTLEATPAE